VLLFFSGALIQVAYGWLNPLALIEWLELQRLLGVEMVGIYNLSINEGPAAQVSISRYQPTSLFKSFSLLVSHNTVCIKVERKHFGRWETSCIFCPTGGCRFFTEDIVGTQSFYFFSVCPVHL